MPRRKKDRAADTASRIDKVRDKLGLHETADLDALDPTALKAHIVTTSRALVENKRTMEEDEDYLKARESLKAVSQPYREEKTRLTLVNEYCSLLLEEKGY